MRLTSASLESQQSVTSFVEDLAGEPLFADKLLQAATSAAEDNGLGVEPGHPLVHRVAVLRGRRSRCPYVQAETWYIPDRLPAPVNKQLEETDDPIGRIFAQSHLPMVRTALRAALPVTQAPSDVVLARQYRIDSGGRPVMAVAEWFLGALTEFLGVGD